MNGEHRIPSWLIVAIIFVILAVGVAAYYAGRFGRSSRLPPLASADLPDPGAPAPAVAEVVSTPAETPPTITPPIPVVIERGSRSSGVMVERSSQIEVPLAPAAPTEMPAAMPIRPETTPTPRSRIAVETPASRPTPTPTIPELERPEEPPLDETPVPPPEEPPPEEPPPEEPPPEEPPPEETPEPEPTVRPGALLRGVMSLGCECGRPRSVTRDVSALGLRGPQVLRRYSPDVVRADAVRAAARRQRGRRESTLRGSEPVSPRGSKVARRS